MLEEGDDVHLFVYQYCIFGIRCTIASVNVSWLQSVPYLPKGKENLIQLNRKVQFLFLQSFAELLTFQCAKNM